MSVVQSPNRVLDTVTLLNCGGTINMSGARSARPDDMVARKLAPALSAQPVPVHVRLERPFARPPDSSNLNEAAWDIIRDRLLHEVAWRHAALDKLGRERGCGVVITHGTDTMAITSLLVSLDMAAERLRFPIIFTGAHSTPDQPGSDAIPNLTRAIAVAGPAHLAVLPPGVFVVIGHDLHLASRLTKVETSPDAHGRYFFSFPAPIGQLAAQGAVLKLEADFLESLRTGPSPIPLVRRGRLGHVAHLILDRFTHPRVLLDAEDQLARITAEKATGLVLQGNFSQSPHWPALRASIERMQAHGVVVAVGSRRVADTLATGPSPVEVCLIPRSLSHPAARLKLAWLLGTSRPPEQLAADLTSNLVGEVFETNALPDWIAYETYPDRLAGTEVVVVRPDLRREAIDDAVARLLALPGSRRELHLYGFGHGHIPGPNRSVADLVQSWLSETPLALDLNAAPDIWSVVAHLSQRMRDLPAELVLAFFAARYTLMPGGLRQAILAARARRQRQTATDALRRHLAQALRAFEADTGATVKSASASIDATVAHTRYTLATPPQHTDLASLDPKALLATLLALDPAPLARRLVKDAVMADSPLHAAVGSATDQGIRVHPRTQVTRGTPDPTKYEAGTLLVAVGAGGDHPKVRPWRIRLLLPRG